MPPATKRPAKKRVKTTPSRKKATPRGASTPRKKGTLSASHKQALAEGRSMSAVVDRYLQSVSTPKRRGRKVSLATLKTRQVAAREAAKTATGVARLVAAQEVRDLGVKITSATASTNGHAGNAEAEFIKIAKTFSAKRGIGYGAWRDAGVPAVVLKKAGIARTRG